MRNSRLAVGIIPARAESSRFPLKVLAPILGKPMLQWVWEAAKACQSLADVLIATDSEEVKRVAEGFGATCYLTPRELNSGTDRIARVAAELNYPLIVNLQGDEPLLSARAVDQLVEALVSDPQVAMATLAVRKGPEDRAELDNPNVVKLVFSEEGRALYFSRAPLLSTPSGEFFKHMGIYAFRSDFLQKFCALPPSRLEQTERLEQLRALENGFGIRVVITEHDTVAVDVPEDVRRVEEMLRRRARTTSSSELPGHT